MHWGDAAVFEDSAGAGFRGRFHEPGEDELFERVVLHTREPAGPVRLLQAVPQQT